MAFDLLKGRLDLLRRRLALAFDPKGRFALAAALAPDARLLVGHTLLARPPSRVAGALLADKVPLLPAAVTLSERG